MMQLLRETDSMQAIMAVSMNPSDWISGIWRLKRAAAPASALPPPALGPRLPRDEEEQAERIRNLAADTDLKIQALAHARVQLFLAFVTVFVALGTFLVASLGVYLTHRSAPSPHYIVIFVTPDPRIMI
jgi:hypothetical protein